MRKTILLIMTVGLLYGCTQAQIVRELQQFFNPPKTGLEECHYDPFGPTLAQQAAELNRAYYKRYKRALPPDLQRRIAYSTDTID